MQFQGHQGVGNGTLLCNFMWSDNAVAPKHTNSLLFIENIEVKKFHKPSCFSCDIPLQRHTPIK